MRFQYFTQPSFLSSAWLLFPLLKELAPQIQFDLITKRVVLLQALASMVLKVASYIGKKCASAAFLSTLPCDTIYGAFYLLLWGFVGCILVSELITQLLQFVMRVPEYTVVGFT